MNFICLTNRLGQRILIRLDDFRGMREVDDEHTEIHVEENGILNTLKVQQTFDEIVSALHEQTVTISMTVTP